MNKNETMQKHGLPVTVVLEHPNPEVIMSQWISLSTIIPEDKIDLVSWIMFDAGALGIVTDDTLDHEFRGIPAHLKYIRVFFYAEIMDKNSRQALKTRVKQFVGPETYQDRRYNFFQWLSISQEQESKSDSWKKFHQPRNLGQKFVVCPPWDLDIRTERLKMIIKPSMAFGTGQHTSTQLLISFLENHPVVYQGGHVLDCGTGSAILAIAAGYLGADNISACDIDPVALTVARENIALNSLTKVIRLVAGSIDCIKKNSIDVILANLDFEILKEHGLKILATLKSNGYCAFSGLLEDECDALIAFISRYGYESFWCKKQDGWAAFSCRYKR